MRTTTSALKERISDGRVGAASTQSPLECFDSITSSSWRSRRSGWFSISVMSKRGSRSRYSAQAPCWKLRSTTQVEAPRVTEWCSWNAVCSVSVVQPTPPAAGMKV